jgi:hypothetical protein
VFTLLLYFRQVNSEVSSTNCRVPLSPHILLGKQLIQELFKRKEKGEKLSIYVG